MNTTTTYLNLTLRSPLVVSACPLSENIDNIKRMEDAGAGAVVLYSLFEEQIRREREALYHFLTHGAESYSEALTYFPEPVSYHRKPDDYLEHIYQSKKAVSIPIIASINGSTPGGWTKFAKRMEEAGADALELNIYHIPTALHMTGDEVEQGYLDILQSVRSTVALPIAVKLSPFFSNMANMAKRLDNAGANGLVLFNRFYQPDIDLETLEVKPKVLLSTPQALRLPLRWIAILRGRIKASMAATGGIHTAEDAIKALLVGADVTMMASVLLKNGIDYLRTVDVSLSEWLEQHEYESVAQLRGSLSQMNVEDPSAFERAQYMQAITSYTPVP